MEPTTTPVLRDRRGIALPFALIGLVAISILVTTVLLTSSSEFAIGNAHRDATASLYSAEATMEQYVMSQVAGNGQIAITPALLQSGDAFTAAGGKLHTVRIAQLSARANADFTAGWDVYSVVVQPADGRGRGVAAFINTVRAFTPVTLNTAINAGATIGGDLSVSGNAQISDGRDTNVNYCEREDNFADFAVQVSAGSTVKAGQQEDRRIDGKQDHAEWTKDQMQKALLGDSAALDTLASYAGIQFGPRFNKAPWPQSRVSGSQTHPVTGSIDTDLNWGCPQEILEKTTCPNNGSRQRHVIVAIDAQGGTVTINGDHGQGMLIVVNGSLRIQGNFVYKGIIMVEKDIFIYGGGGNEDSKVEGAVIAFGSASDIEDNVSGTATVKYNLCAILDAERALNAGGLARAPSWLGSAPYAWHEIIR